MLECLTSSSDEELACLLSKTHRHLQCTVVWIGTPAGESNLYQPSVMTHRSVIDSKVCLQGSTQRQRQS